MPKLTSFHECALHGHFGKVPYAKYKDTSVDSPQHIGDEFTLSEFARRFLSQAAYNGPLPPLGFVLSLGVDCVTAFVEKE